MKAMLKMIRKMNEEDEEWENVGSAP